EMAETEDVIQALMDTLVDHILPPRYLPFPLSKSAQNAVAEQMHAVVLLYNYYHRKQNPEQRLLSFHDFSKLAMVLKPNLSPFMKTMMENRHTELQDFDDHHLSVVEKAIKNACDVAAALDASEDFSSRKGWPISKLAVLLIDSQCENCYVEVADGGWFFIEKQVEGHGEKRKRSTEDSSTDGTKLLGLAFDAAKQITGGIENEVQVVGTHFTYATSKAKSVAVCYVMQYSGSLSCIGERQVPLMFVHECLQGRITENSDWGTFKTASNVKHHRLLPYINIISGLL
ncbi:hypothetical protein M569_02323, partial [Genlisea aurea]